MRLIHRASLRGFHATTRALQVARTPIEEYDRLIKLGRLRDDPYQRKIISNLAKMHTDLVKYKPPKVITPDPDGLQPKKGLGKLLSNVFKAKVKEPTGGDYKDIPKGIYLFGDVGCGKTMLMDLFYSTVPEHLPKKRLHFHQFMQNLHKRRHQILQKHGAPDMDPIPILAAEIAQEATVLCFDEFQVTDVADAMLLRRLLTTTLAPDHGLVLFTTSNRSPDELYINGIQRQSFIPCIELLKERTEVIFLDSPTDYRKIPKPVSSVYFTPKGGPLTSTQNALAAKEHIENWYSFFSQGHSREENLEISIWGRKLVVPLSSPPNVAKFTFHELCGEPLAAGDYIALATNYNAFIITDIPYLSVNVRDQVRRLITFLDAVYDNHGRLCVTAAAPFEDLFVEPEDLKTDYELKPQTKQVDANHMHDDELVKQGFSAKVAKNAQMFQLDEEKFAFARALSRLSQMATQDWVDNNGIKK